MGQVRSLAEKVRFLQNANGQSSKKWEANNLDNFPKPKAGERGNSIELHLRRQVYSMRFGNEKRIPTASNQHEESINAGMHQSQSSNQLAGRRHSEQPSPSTDAVVLLTQQRKSPTSHHLVLDNNSQFKRL